MKRKGFAAVILMTAMLAGITTASAAAVFPDVSQTAWYADYVAQAVEQGIVEGYPDGTFKPDKLLKYGEFIAMMVEQQTTAEKVTQQQSTHWSFPYYCVGLQKGYYTESQIPAVLLDAPIPRKDMAVIAAGFLKQNAQCPARVEGPAYGDVDMTDPDTYYIYLCSHMGVLEGYTADRTFKPDKTLKRSEAVKVAVCCMDLKIEEEEQPDDSGQEVPAEDPVKAQAPDMVILKYDAVGDPIVKNVTGLIPADRKVIMDQIKDSFKITKENGKFYLSYTQPQIPETWEIHISCKIFNTNGQGIYSYGNTKGVGIHPEYWPEIRKAKAVKEEISGVGGALEDKAISVTLSINERPRSGLFGATTYQIWKDNEGNPDFFRIIAGFDGESYTEEFYGAPSFRHWD